MAFIKINALQKNLLPRLKTWVNPEQLKSWNRLPIRQRLISGFLVVSIVPILIMGLVSIYISQGAITNKVEKYSIRELAQTNSNLTLSLKQYEDFSLKTIANTEISEALSKSSNALNESDRYSNVRKIQEYFQASFAMESGLTVAFYPLNHQKYIFSGRDVGLDAFEKTELFKKAQHETTIWDLSGREIVFVKLIKDLNTSTVLGTIAIFINEDNLDKIVNQTLYNEADFSQDRISEFPYSIAINQKGTIILSPFKDDLGKSITSIVRESNFLKEISDGNHRTISANIKNKDVLVTFSTVEKKNWYLLDIAPKSYLYSESGALVLWALVIGIALAALSIYISFIVALGISNPLEKVMQAMHLAEKGDLSVNVVIENEDELGRLGSSFNLMITKIRELIVDTKNAIAEVLDRSKILEDNSAQSARTSESVSMATTEITRGTMEQTQETENATLRMGELAKQIESVVLKSNEVEHFSESARTMSVDAKYVIQHMMKKANDTDEITNSVIRDINELNTSADEIRSITEVITNIAEQTNLLALNAAIEAARAGDMGLGFAVVADEVNKLAAQSQVAAKTINTILKGIQTKTSASAQTASQAHKIVEEQLEAVQKAQQSFDEIIVAVDNIVHRMSDVNDNIKKINTVKESTMNAIMNISAISEETAASSEEVSASTEEQTAIAEQVSILAKDLLKMSDKLVESIAKFKVNQ